MKSLTRTITAVARGALLLWGLAIAIMAILELIEPGFLRSERSLYPAITRLDVLPGVILMMILSALGLAPSGWIASRRRNRAAAIAAVTATLGLAVWAPARIGTGTDFSWSVVPQVLLVYGLPATLAIFLGSLHRAMGGSLDEET